MANPGLRLLMKVLVIALLLSTTLLGTASAADVAGSDDSAIASFLSIGFANAPTQFSSIRGDQMGSASVHQATQWPDRTYFLHCYTLHQAPISVGGVDAVAERYSYSCSSTLRSSPQATLFKMAEHAMRANLPRGYASSGVEQGDLGPQEVWKRAGSPSVRLWVKVDQDKAYYELSVDVE